jgi:hypothetical protein
MEFLATIASISMDGRPTWVALCVVRVVLRRKAPFIYCDVRGFWPSGEGWRFPCYCTLLYRQLSGSHASTDRHSFDALHNPPAYRLSICLAVFGMRSVHSVGRAATTHVFLLLLLILSLLWSSSVGKQSVSGYKLPDTGFKLFATGFITLSGTWD